MSVFGKSYGKKITGQLFKDGKEVIFNNVSQAIKNGVAYVSEDRKEYGLILMDSVREKIMMGDMDRVSKRHILDKNKEVIEAEKLKKQMNIKTPSIDERTMNLRRENKQIEE